MMKRQRRSNAMTDFNYTAREIADMAIRLDNDVNGNPRYYVPCFAFMRKFGVLSSMYRPAYASKYRGKKFGAGWVFQSYNLVEDLTHSLEAA